MLKSKKIIASIAIVVVLGAVAALGLGAWAVKTVLAQTPSPTQQPNGQAPAGVSQYEQLFLQSLADQLNTTVDKLKAAITSAAGTVIDKAVQDGKITQSQADQLKQKAANGNFPGPFLFGGKGMRGGFEGFGGHMGMMGVGVQEFASALNMTPQELMTELQSGKSIADVATEKGVDLAKVKQTVLDAAKAKLDTAVKNQQLTQAQADKVYQNLSSNMDQIVQQKGFMGRGMHGGWKNWNQNPQQQPPTVSPGAGL